MTRSCLGWPKHPAHRQPRTSDITCARKIRPVPTVSLVGSDVWPQGSAPARLSVAPSAWVETWGEEKTWPPEHSGCPCGLRVSAARLRSYVQSFGHEPRLAMHVDDIVKCVCSSTPDGFPYTCSTTASHSVVYPHSLSTHYNSISPKQEQGQGKANMKPSDDIPAGKKQPYDLTLNGNMVRSLRISRRDQSTTL